MKIYSTVFVGNLNENVLSSFEVESIKILNAKNKTPISE